MRDERTRRRACLLGLAMLIAVPATAGTPRQRRQPRAARAAPAPANRPPAGDARKPAAGGRAASAIAEAAKPPADVTSRPRARRADSARPAPGANAAEAARRPGDAKRQATARAAPTPAQTVANPQSHASAGDARRPAAGRAAPPPPPHATPQIDGPSPPSRRPGLEPAPVPNGNILPPIGERQVGPNVSFGVPTPPLLIERQSFRSNDVSPQARQQQQQGGPRLPSPGATVRLPF
jgi:hypothetical protein